MSRPRLLSLAFVPIVASLAAACSSTPDGGAESVGQSSSAIINGQLDTTHNAVVAVILAQGSQGGICSGTIVKVDAARKIGWVATAAHCVDLPPKYIIGGPDFLAQSAIVYKVLDYEANPNWNQVGGANDFAMVRIAGVDGSTPIIPLTTSPDGLSTGGTSSFTSVGYGRTSLTEPSNPEDQNTKRYVIKKNGYVSQTEISYNMATSGICQGDSGGPVIAGTGASEKVVGIHSYVQGDCNGTGVSSRVSYGAGFWNQQLAKALPPDNCQTCDAVANSGTQECAQLNKACLDDPECKAFSECLASGKKKADCLVTHPKAEGPFSAAANCVCTRACTSQCGASESCKAAPKCGYPFPAGDCKTCTEGACCQEAIDCAADGTCYLCLKKGDDADPGCATNAKRKALATCSASKCKTECAGDPITNNADPVPEEGEGGGEGGGSTTTKKTTEGCSTAPSHTSSGAFALVGVALAIAALRRRRREPHTSL